MKFISSLNADCPENSFCFSWRSSLFFKTSYLPSFHSHGLCVTTWSRRLEHELSFFKLSLSQGYINMAEWLKRHSWGKHDILIQSLLFCVLSDIRDRHENLFVIATTSSVTFSSAFHCRWASFRWKAHVKRTIEIWTSNVNMWKSLYKEHPWYRTFLKANYKSFLEFHMNTGVLGYTKQTIKQIQLCS